MCRYLSCVQNCLGFIGRVSRIVKESRDPCTNPQGFAQAEHFEYDIEVIPAFHSDPE